MQLSTGASVHMCGCLCNELNSSTYIHQIANLKCLTLETEMNTLHVLTTTLLLIQSQTPSLAMMSLQPHDGTRTCRMCGVPMMLGPTSLSPMLRLTQRPPGHILNGPNPKVPTGAGPSISCDKGAISAPVAINLLFSASLSLIRWATCKLAAGSKGSLHGRK